MFQFIYLFMWQSFSHLFSFCVVDVETRVEIPPILRDIISICMSCIWQIKLSPHSHNIRDNYCSTQRDMYSSICFPISFLIITNKINQFLFFPWQSNHFYIKDNLLIPWNTWRTSRGFTTFWSKCQITLKVLRIVVKFRIPYQTHILLYTQVPKQNLLEQ